MSKWSTQFSPGIRERMRAGALFAGVLLLGALFIAWAVRREDRLMREELLLQTRILAQTIPLDQLKVLFGNLSDEKKPEYRRLKEQLQAAVQVNPAWKWIYLMGCRKNGVVFFQLDSEAYDAPDPSPPGQFYEEASPVLHGVFDTRVSATEGPVPDRWGVWVSAFVPLVDPKTGQLVTVVGIDIEASHWRLKAVRAGFVPLVFTALMLSILATIHWLRKRVARANSDVQKRRWRHWEAALAVATGLTLTLTTVWLARLVEVRHQKEAFASLAHLKTGRILDAFLTLRNSELEGLARFIEGNEQMTGNEFRGYARHLIRVPEVLAWAWVPLVPGAEKDAFEQAVHDAGWQGPTYQIWEADASGAPVPAASRKTYYPIYHVSTDKSLLQYGITPGRDLGAIDSIRATIEETVQTGLMTSTEILPSLPGAASLQRLLLVFRPIHAAGDRRRIRGVVMAAVDPEVFLKAFLGENLAENRYVSLDLLHLRAGEPPVSIASISAPGVPHESPFPLAGPWTLTRPVLAFGRTYAVAIRPSAAFKAYHAFHLGWIALLAGLSITAAGAIAIGVLAHRREDMERLVDERTFDLASSMRRYDLLARQSRTITWETDADGLYTDISPVAEDILGWRPEDLIGRKHFYDLHPAEGREAFKVATFAAFSGREPFLDFVNPVETAAGDILWVSTNGMPVLNPDGSLRGYQGTDKDITDRRRGEEALAALARQNQEAAERYRTLISASNTGAWEYHDDTAYMWASPEYFAMLGRKSADFDLAPGHPNIEATWLDLLHPDDKESARRYFVDYLKKPEGMYQHTFRMRHADGHWAWILSRGRVLRDGSGRPTPVVVGTHIDITDTKRTEQALLDSEAKYRMLTESMKDVVWTLDTETLRFLYVSPSVEQMRGYTAEEVAAAPLEDSLVPEELEDLRRTIRTQVAALRSGAIPANTYFTNEIHQPHKNGSVVCAEVVTRYFFNEHTGRAELHGVTRDITERKRAERYREMGIKTLQILNQPGDLNDLLRELAAMLKEGTGLDAVGIRLQNGNQFPYAVQQGFACDFALEENDLLARDAAGNPLREAAGGTRLRCTCGLVLSGNTDPNRHLFTSGGSCWTNDAARLLDVAPGEDPRFQPRNRCIRDGYASLALVPIHSQGRIVGLLQFNDRRKGQFSLETIQILEGLAAHVGEALTRKRAEQDYRTLFHEMLEGFAVHEILCDDRGRPIDYRFLAMNPTFERMTGLKAEEIVGKTVLEVLPQTEPAWIETFGRVALTGEPAFFQHHAAALGKHFEVTAFRPAPKQFACIFSDITERKRADDKLRESRRQYAALLANLPGMAYRCQNDRSWTMEFISEGCRELTGYAPDDLVGNKTVAFNDLILPAYRERLWAEWQQVLRERGKFEGEYEIATRDGAVKWVWEQGEGVYDEAGGLLALEGFISDITARKRAESERERLTRAIEQSREIIVITDAEGSILYVNPAFTRATGFSREETVGRNPRILQSGRHDAAFYRDMWTALLAGRTWEGQIVNKRKDGSLYTEQASISPVRDLAGRIVHFVAVKHDITRELAEQKEKEHLQSQLVQAQKMESIGRLAGGVAHDFNNMLQAILGYTEMALEQAKPDHPLHGDLKEIQKAAQRSALLTRQLQAFARKQVAAPRTLDLNEAVAGMTDMLRRLIGEKIELEWIPGENIGLVRIDPVQIDQIVANLCINARDAIENSGRIAIETGSRTIDRPIRGAHGEIAPGSYVVLTIRDDGNGMPPEVLDHIFEPFFTTKQPGKGTGLGLATVYGIVRQNQGGIQVESAPRAGSTFRVFLPRHAGTADPEPASESPAPGSRGAETILLVEDENTILQAARRVLESLGYRVLATKSAEEALRLAETHKADIRLVVSDVIMPEMNGPEMIRRMLERHPALRHLYMSGYAANLIAEQGVRENGVNFIQKPFTRKSLARMVRLALDRA